MTTADASAANSADRRGTSRLSRGIGGRPVGADPREVLRGLNRGAILSRLQTTYKAQVGRGFYALLETAVPTALPAARGVEPVASEYRVVLVDPRAVLPNRYRPPVEVQPEELGRLAQSIREQGLLEPIHVMAAPQGMGDETPHYWVIFGERRRQAALRAGLQRLPVIIRNVTVRAGLQMLLAQSIHTRPLSDLDRAQVYATLTTKMGMSVEEVAQRVGASTEEIQQDLALLTQTRPIQPSPVYPQLTQGQA